MSPPSWEQFRLHVPSWAHGHTVVVQSGARGFHFLRTRDRDPGLGPGAWVPRLFFSDVMGSHTRAETLAKMCGYAPIEVIYITRSFSGKQQLSLVAISGQKQNRECPRFTGSRRHQSAPRRFVPNLRHARSDFLARSKTHALVIRITATPPCSPQNPHRPYAVALRSFSRSS